MLECLKRKRERESVRAREGKGKGQGRRGEERGGKGGRKKKDTENLTGRSYWIFLWGSSSHKSGNVFMLNQNNGQ